MPQWCSLSYFTLCSWFLFHSIVAVSGEKRICRTLTFSLSPFILVSLRSQMGRLCLSLKRGRNISNCQYLLKGFTSCCIGRGVAARPLGLVCITSFVFLEMCTLFTVQLLCSVVLLQQSTLSLHDWYQNIDFISLLFFSFKLACGGFPSRSILNNELHNYSIQKRQSSTWWTHTTHGRHILLILSMRTERSFITTQYEIDFSIPSSTVLKIHFQFDFAWAGA